MAKDWESTGRRSEEQDGDGAVLANRGWRKAVAPPGPGMRGPEGLVVLRMIGVVVRHGMRVRSVSKRRSWWNAELPMKACAVDVETTGTDEGWAGERIGFPCKNGDGGGKEPREKGRENESSKIPILTGVPSPWPGHTFPPLRLPHPLNHPATPKKRVSARVARWESRRIIQVRCEYIQNRGAT